MTSRRSAHPHENPYRAALAKARGAFWGAGAFSAAINILMLTGSVYMLQIYDRVLPSGSRATLLGLFLIVVVLYAFLGLYEFLRTRILSRTALGIEADVAPAAFRAWLSAGREGQRDAQPLRDVEAVRSFLSGPAPHGLFDMPWIPLYLGVLFLVHPWLGWLTVAGGLVIGLVALFNRRKTEADLPRAQSMEAAARSFAEQGLRTSESLRALGMEAAVGREWDSRRAAAQAALQKGGDIGEATSAFSKAFRLLLQSAILSLGALLVLRHELSAGMIIASSILSGRALAPIDQVIGQWKMIARARVSHHRLLAFFDARPPEPQRVHLPAPTGPVEVSRLTKFAPNRREGGEPARILSQVGFTLEPGDALGVIGNSASGKSTLARLLVGAWSPDAGEVRLDGATYDQWEPEEIGRHIGYLPQQIELLSGTIGQNIARFDPAASDKAVVEAARLAGVHEMVLALPDGYATRVGPGETMLSGGQVQRVALARAVFGEPHLVVLDEPNSNLDAQGDTALSAAIAALREQGAIVVVMAHRPSALASVNKLMILQGGTMLRFGTKEEVLHKLSPVPTPTPAAVRGAAPDATSLPSPDETRKAAE